MPHSMIPSHADLLEGASGAELLVLAAMSNRAMRLQISEELRRRAVLAIRRTSSRSTPVTARLRHAS